MTGERERHIQKAVCNYLKIRYSRLNLLIFSDLAGQNLSFKSRSEYKNRSNDSFPDLMVFHRTIRFSGMCLELKKEGTKIYRKDGELVANKHIQKQANTLRRMRAQGYYADFGIGLDDCINKIDNYFKNQ